MAVAELDEKASPDTSGGCVLSVDFHRTDGTDMLVELYEADDDYMYIFIDGKYSGALLERNHIFGINSVDNFYNAFVEAMS